MTFYDEIKDITGLWVLQHRRHYFVNVNRSLEWHEVDEGRVVKKYELMEVYGELEDEITLMSKDGKSKLVLTHREVIYSRMSRKMTSKITQKGYGKWEVLPEFENENEYDDDESESLEDEENIETIGKNLKN